MKLAIYPGSFDPITNGHIDVLNRALNIFDKVIIAVAKNASKKPFFSIDERLELIKQAVEPLGDKIIVDSLEGLTIDYAKKNNAVSIIRGLRAVSDFEFEFQMAQMNRHLQEEIETIFLMPSRKHFYTSSSLVKQVCPYTIDRLEVFVPKNVLIAMKQKLENKANLEAK